MQNLCIQGLFLTAASVGSGGAYAPFHRSEYFNLSCHCLSHSSRDCIGRGIIKSHKAKQEKAREKQRQEEEQEIEDYDE